MGQRTGAAIQAAKFEAPARFALTDFGGVKTDRVQVLQFIHQPPKKGRLARSRKSGNQDVIASKHYFLLFFF
jgi:hypothetical protein